MDHHELRALADEELSHALTLSWRELAKITPWGDSYRGFAPSGAEVEFERNYIWACETGDAILCEVTVRLLPERADTEARAACRIEREAVKG